MKMKQKKFNWRGKLSTKIALTTSFVTLIFLTALILIVVLNVNSIVSKSAISEFYEIAENNANSIQQMLTTAEKSNQGILDYHQKNYEMLQSESYGAGKKSIFYGKPLTDSASEAEKYYMNQLRTIVKYNSIFQGMGVYFEPYSFDKNIENYSFYLYRDDSAGSSDKDLGVVYAEDYFQEEWYVNAIKAGKEIVSKPYLEEGQTIVSVSTPLMYNGNTVGVVLIDINIDEFENIKASNENYNTMFSAVINNYDQYLFNSQDKALSGQSIKSIFHVESEYQYLKQKINEGKEFFVETTSPEGEKYKEFFKPVTLGDTIWWSYTGVQCKDLLKDVHKLLIFMILASAVSLVLLVVLSTIQIVKKLKPLEQLNLAADALLQGNLDYQITYESKDEIGKACGGMRNAFLSLQRIIKEISKWMAALESHDLTITPSVEFHGEFAAIENSYKSLLKTLNDGFKEIKSSADQINVGAGQVSSGAQTLAQGAAEQAASVQALSDTITDISEKIRLNAKNASEANEISTQIRTDIMESSHCMSDLMAAMKEITNASTEVNNIIKTIDDIAFQTNILALNAAVEAARAGEAGKGFAVVANEVRNLAGRSAEAAKSTNLLIESSINAVSDGTNIANQTEKSLEQVVANAKIITDKIQKIAASSKEQSNSVVQINNGADQISSVVQTNSATSEESAAASEELAGQANMLDSLINQFKLIEGTVSLDSFSDDNIDVLANSNESESVSKY